MHPPPIVPKVLPSSKISIFVPAFRGVDPVVRVIVAMANVFPSVMSSLILLKITCSIRSNFDLRFNNHVRLRKAVLDFSRSGYICMEMISIGLDGAEN
jgi:hypothetical protein